MNNYKDAVRCPKHDAYYRDNSWLESKCSDKTCDFCKDRPEKPSDVKDRGDYS